MENAYDRVSAALRCHGVCDSLRKGSGHPEQHSCMLFRNLSCLLWVSLNLLIDHTVYIPRLTLL